MTERSAEILKFVVAGAFGVGKTTLIGAVSEIPPLRTEALLTEASSFTDSLHGVEAKQTTTVALDFGRITFGPMELFLFGTPGQERFRSMWDTLTIGAHGAVILVDPRRLAESFHVVDYFESSGLPFVVAVNVFDGAAHYPEYVITRALRLSETTPVISCDARDRRSVGNVLITLADYSAFALTA